MFNVKHKTTGGIKASAAQSPCHFYPMQLLVGRNQTQILEGKRVLGKKKKFGGRCKCIFRMQARQAICQSHPTLECTFTSNWQKERHGQHLPSRVPKCPRLCSQCLAQANSEDPQPRLKSARSIDFCFRLLCFVGDRVPVSPLLGGEQDRDSRDSIQYL